MAENNEIAAVSRTEFGKGAARRIRRSGMVPAVLYGHGTDPIHVSLPGHQVQLALRVANALLSVTVDGQETQLALPKQVQRNPVKDTIEHVDLVIVRRGEKVTVEVPLVIVGEERADRLVLLERQTVPLEVEATNIPADLQLDVSGLEVGSLMLARDLPLPEGVVYVGEPDDVVVTVEAPRSAEEPEAEVEETEETEEAEED